MIWKLLKKEVIFKNKLARIDGVEEWTMRLPRGGSHRFVINRQKDFVLVCALTRDKRVVTIRQYYVNVGRTEQSLVAGFIDGRQTPLSAAKRELQEETGFTAERWVNLGKSLKGKYTTGYAHHFLALGARSNGGQNLEPAEEIAVRLLPLFQFKAAVAAGRFSDVFVEVCARRALRYLEQHRLV